MFMNTHTKHGLGILKQALVINEQENIEIIPFVNGDTLFHQVSTDSFGYIYSGEKRLKHCVKLDERAVYPSFG